MKTLKEKFAHLPQLSAEQMKTVKGGQEEDLPPGEGNWTACYCGPAPSGVSTRVCRTTKATCEAVTGATCEEDLCWRA